MKELKTQISGLMLAAVDIKAGMTSMQATLDVVSGDVSTLKGGLVETKNCTCALEESCVGLK